MADDALRLDKFLWFARFVKTRTAAQQFIQSNRVRIDGRIAERASASVRPGSVLTFAQGARVRVIRVDTLPIRRGPAPEVAACFTDLASQSPVDASPPPK